MLSMYLFYMCSQCSFTGLKTKIIDETCLACGDGFSNKKAKLGDESYMIQYNGLDKYECCVRSYFKKYSEKPDSIVPGTSQKAPLETPIDQACLQTEYIRGKEIFNNHMQQQINEVAQDAIQKIEICKNIKKNTPFFLELTEETKKLLFKQLNYKEGKILKINDIKDKLRKNDSYKSNKFMKKDVIETFNLTEYMPECITKYDYNKEIFEEQTQTIKTIFDTGIINFDKFFEVLDGEIIYVNHDKETLAELVDLQMNNFLHKNINSLTLLFPKMQFFMEYYNKYQDNLVFFEDMKHVCMVYGMMHILETILKCTEHMVDKIKDINRKIIECSNSNRKYMHNRLNLTIVYYLVTKCEIEKMLLYILQSFLPTDHFIDLVKLFYVESVCSYGIFRNHAAKLRFDKPNNTESAIMQLSTYCYIHFDSLVTDTSDTKKNITHVFFSYFMNVKVDAKKLAYKPRHTDIKDLSILNSIFYIYISKNADKLCETLKETYNILVVKHKNTQNKILSDIMPIKEKNLTQNKITNGVNNIIDDENRNHKSKQNLDKNVENINRYTKYSIVVFYILNYMSKYIIACEATFIMSYDITGDKKILEDLIDYYMKILENWNDTKYKHKNVDISFKRPHISKKMS